MGRRNFHKKNNNVSFSDRKIRIQAKNLDQALSEAERRLGVEKTRIKYDIISQTGFSLLSFLGFSKVEIDAWVEKKVMVKNSSREEPLKKKSKPQDRISKKKQDRQSRKKDVNESDGSFKKEELKDESSSLTDEEFQAFISDAISFTSGICSYLSDEKVNVSTKLDDDRLIVNIDNQDIRDIMHKTPKLYEALEHLIRKKPRFLKRELPFRIFVDSCGQRIEKENSLVVLAMDMARKVSSTQKPIVLDYKSPADRRIIHMALDKNEFVYTKSIGSGSNRKLMILPKGEGSVSMDSSESSSSSDVEDELK